VQMLKMQGSQDEKNEDKITEERAKNHLFQQYHEQKNK
jgi:hypothetical protein